MNDRVTTRYLAAGLALTLCCAAAAAACGAGAEGVVSQPDAAAGGDTDKDAVDAGVDDAVGEPVERLVWPSCPVVQIRNQHGDLTQEFTYDADNVMTAYTQYAQGEVVASGTYTWPTEQRMLGNHWNTTWGDYTTDTRYDARLRIRETRWELTDRVAVERFGYVSEDLDVPAGYVASRHEIDNDDDGVVDRIVERAFDTQGLLVEETEDALPASWEADQTDLAMDGVLDWRKTYTYGDTVVIEEDGSRSKSGGVTIMSPPDGEPEMVTTRFFDGPPDPRFERWVRSVNAWAEGTSEYLRTYDEGDDGDDGEGRLRSHEFWGSNGELWFASHYTYACD